jgi:hypothetical protein
MPARLLLQLVASWCCYDTNNTFLWKDLQERDDDKILGSWISSEVSSRFTKGYVCKFCLH